MASFLSVAFFALASLFALILSPPVSSQTTIRNCSYRRYYVSRPSSLNIIWILPPPNFPLFDCNLTIDLAYSIIVELSYFSGGSPYIPSAECTLQGASWRCNPHCRGLFYSRSLTSGRPFLINSMQPSFRMTATELRLLFCHGEAESRLPYSPIEIELRAFSSRNGDNYYDPVWRVLGPVLATVCMIATVFLICVCYVQHSYERGAPPCCRWLCHRFRGLRPRDSSEQTTSGTETTQQGPPVRPNVSAEEGLPPPYDDHHKYHRPCSFNEVDTPRPRVTPQQQREVIQSRPPVEPVVPPSYGDAVLSLQQGTSPAVVRPPVRRSLSCGATRDRRETAGGGPSTSAGFDNPAFLSEENAPPAFSRLWKPPRPQQRPTERQAPPQEQPGRADRPQGRQEGPDRPQGRHNRPQDRRGRSRERRERPHQSHPLRSVVSVDDIAIDVDTETAGSNC